MFKKIVFFLVLLQSFSSGSAYAEGFGLGTHAGFGVIKYEENTSAFGDEVESKAVLNTALFGVSGEYSLKKPDNFFAGITTDWAFGLEDRENWKENGVKIQTDDLEIFGQFYDIRFGYKNSISSFYYRAYISGGWDGIHFSRDNFVVSGRPESGSVTENFSLWRTGGGIGAGYKFDKWALDGRAAYAYYPRGQVRNSSLSQFTFDTTGACLDVGAGIARELIKNVNLYLGGSYTLIELKESDIERDDSVQAVFPESETQIIVGVANLTFAF
ncbi:MAG: hypothetical protein HZA14_09865 [Nitrospirae bacterium]|nr:hypothetical protein [Nitrospirota bacterium]